MNILITGASGFIGTHLTGRLLESGNQCRCLVRDVHRAKNIFSGFENIDFVQGDITQKDSLKGVASNIDIVYHLAALGTGLPSTQSHEKRLRQVNVEGTENILMECSAAPLRKFIHFSSSSIVGTLSKSDIDEYDPCFPITPYQRSKYEGEQMVSKYWRNSNVPAVILRPCMVYGPGGKGRMFDMARLIQKGLFFKIGKGGKMTPLVHVRDVVQAAILAGVKAAPGEIYYIASEDSYKMDGVRALIVNNLSIKRPYFAVPAGPAKFFAGIIEILAKLARYRPMVSARDIDTLMQDRFFRIDKAKKHLGYNPSVLLESGIKETLDWYREQNLL